MKPALRCLAVIPLILSVVCFSGCKTSIEYLKGALAISTKVLEEGRIDALTKVYACKADDCYQKTLKFLKEGAAKDQELKLNLSIYAEDPVRRMVAFYYVDVNTTPVGVFFKEMDPKHTKIQVSSPSPEVKKIIADRIFSGLSI